MLNAVAVADALHSRLTKGLTMKSSPINQPCIFTLNLVHSDWPEALRSFGNRGSQSNLNFTIHQFRCVVFFRLDREMGGFVEINSVLIFFARIRYL